MRESTRGMSMVQKLLVFLNPIEEYVEIVDNGMSKPCLIWQGSTTKGGYAKMSHQVDNVRKHYDVHRQVCILTHGMPPMPDDVTEHICANRNCISPDHLQWGSYRDNLREWKTRKVITRTIKQRDHMMEAFDELFQSAQEIVIGLGVWGDVDEELVDSALQELHNLVFAD